MRNFLIISIIVVLAGWTIYEFAYSSNDSNTAAEPEEIDAEEFVVSSEIENFDDDNIDKGVRSLVLEEAESEPYSVEEGINVGDLAPDFQLTTLKEGEVKKLSDYRGEKVMINFWATWCPPCRAEMPDIEKFYQDTDIEVLAINLTDTESSLDKVDEFVEDYGINFTILMDESIEVANQYAIQPIPTSFFIDSNGVIQFKHIGPLHYNNMLEMYETLE